jgi:hypothetical protein
MKMTPSRNRLAAIVVVAVGMWASPAAAQTPVNNSVLTGQAPIADAAPAARFSWYGYQTLAVDAAVVALASTAIQGNSAPPAFLAAVGYAFGAPTVHALHRRPLAAAGSFALRVFLPPIGMAIGAAVTDCRMLAAYDEHCDFGEQLVGFVVGMAAAAVIDAAAIAWERKAAPAPDHSPPPAAAPSSSMLSLAPFPMRDGGGGLLFSGRF